MPTETKRPVGRPRVSKKFSDETTTCECGCGTVIRKYDKIHGRPLRFAKGHQNKMLNANTRLGKGPLAQHRGEKILCACGCGTEIALYNSGHLGHYLRGHGTKGKPSPRKGIGKKNSTETKLCSCGCGTVIPKYDSYGREREMVAGHIWKGQHSPIFGKHQPESQRQKLSEYHSGPESRANARLNSFGNRTLYNGILFMSQTEAQRAKQLDALGYHWQYEPTRISYVGPDDRTHNYTPDFWVNELDRYEEIKGYFSDQDRIKMALVTAQHPELTIAILTKNDFRSL